MYLLWKRLLGFESTGANLKIYWSLVLLFYLIWIGISHKYPDPNWWSIFTEDRSTHTPLMEHISLIKVTITLLIFGGLAYRLHKFNHRRKNE